MAGHDGYALQADQEAGDTDGACPVFLHNFDAPVYPNAPRIKVVGSTQQPGFGIGDECHYYGLRGDSQLELACVLRNDAMDRFLNDFGGEVWAETASTGNPAVILFRTPAGGRIMVSDLRTVNRLPEPSGVEGPAIQVFINGLGLGTTVFGKFIRTYPAYEAFIETVRTLAAQYPGLATVERIGHSTKNRDMWVLKVGAASNERAVLMSTAIHSLEWGPTYGALRMVRSLLHECQAQSVYAREVLGNRQLWWVLCANPDGWETRDQEALGINLNRNFPAPPAGANEGGGLRWDAYNKKFNPVSERTEREFGPAPGSEAETQTLMHLLRNGNRDFATMADFHETTAPCSFYHQKESEDGNIHDMPYHLELIEDAAAVSNSRFWANANVMAYGAAHSDPTTYRVGPYESITRLVPSTTAGWQGYAANLGLKTPLVEAAGCDCTHYQTIRRTDYAALVIEQILAAEEGRLLRNPWGQERQVTVTIHRPVLRVRCRIYDANDVLVKEWIEDNPDQIVHVIPPGGWLRLKYIPE